VPTPAAVLTIHSITSANTRLATMYVHRKPCACLRKSADDNMQNYLFINKKDIPVCRQRRATDLGGHVRPGLKGQGIQTGSLWSTASFPSKVRAQPRATATTHFMQSITAQLAVWAYTRCFKCRIITLSVPAPPIVGGGGIVFSGMLSVRPSVRIRPVSVNTYDAISLWRLGHGANTSGVG